MIELYYAEDDANIANVVKEYLEQKGIGYTDAVKPPVRRIGNHKSGHKETGIFAAEPPSRR